uniref:Uncharacterized protein n=1 Tax=Gopherus agassizii TaxID=38772 RepID=A0A452GGF1_9SAUR
WVLPPPNSPSPSLAPGPSAPPPRYPSRLATWLLPCPSSSTSKGVGWMVDDSNVEWEKIEVRCRNAQRRGKSGKGEQGWFGSTRSVRAEAQQPSPFPNMV